MNTAAQRNAAVTAWETWHARCLLARCPAAVAALLQRFADARFRTLLNRLRSGSAACEGIACPPASEAWQRFESHLCVRQTRQGKVYKEWLFARLPAGAADALDVIQGGATLILRNVVRDYLAREATPRHWTSLDQPLPGVGPDGPTLHDLLPGRWDPSAEAARRDMERLAARQARAFATTLSPREQCIFAARSAGRPLSDPALLAETGCAKSHVYRSYQAAVRRLVRRLLNLCRHEPREVVMELALLTLQRLGEHQQQKKEGKSDACLLSITVGTTGESRRRPPRKEAEHAFDQQSYSDRSSDPGPGNPQDLRRYAGVRTRRGDQ